MYSWQYIEVWPFFYGNIGPPVPGGHSDLRRKVVNAEDRSAFITPYNYQGLIHARHRVVYNLCYPGFPFTLYSTHIQLFFLDQLCDQRVLSDSTYQDNRPGSRNFISSHYRAYFRYAVYIRL